MTTSSMVANRTSPTPSQKLGAWVLGRELMLLHFYLVQWQFARIFKPIGLLPLIEASLGSLLRAVRVAVEEDHLPDTLAASINSDISALVAVQSSNRVSSYYHEDLDARNDEIKLLTLSLEWEVADRRWMEHVSCITQPIHKVMQAVESQIQRELDPSLSRIFHLAKDLFAEAFPGDICERQITRIEQLDLQWFLPNGNVAFAPDAIPSPHWLAQVSERLGFVGVDLSSEQSCQLRLITVHQAICLIDEAVLNVFDDPLLADLATPASAQLMQADAPEQWFPNSELGIELCPKARSVRMVTAPTESLERASPLLFRLLWVFVVRRDITTSKEFLEAAWKAVGGVAAPTANVIYKALVELRSLLKKMNLQLLTQPAGGWRLQPCPLPKEGKASATENRTPTHSLAGELYGPFRLVGSESSNSAQQICPPKRDKTVRRGRSQGIRS